MFYGAGALWASNSIRNSAYKLQRHNPYNNCTMTSAKVERANQDKYTNDDYKKNAEVKEGKGYTVYHEKELTEEQQQKYDLYTRLNYMEERNKDIDKKIEEINKLDTIADSMINKYGQEKGMFIIISGYMLDDEKTIENLTINSASYRQQHFQEFKKICNDPYSLDDIFEFNAGYQDYRFNEVLNILNNYYRQRGESWYHDDLRRLINYHSEILDLPNYKVIQEFENMYNSLDPNSFNYYEARKKSEIPYSSRMKK